MVDIETLRGLVAAMRAVAAAEIMPRFAAGALARQKTGPHDLVTEADIAAERALEAWARDALPGAAFFGEEAVESGAASVAGLAEAELALVVDPVDGTVNFASGTPMFMSMAALASRGRVLASALLDPVLDRAYVALRGGGAWLWPADGPAQALSVAAPQPLETARGVSDASSLDPAGRAVASAALDPARAVFSFRCSGHEYRLLASGGCDFMVAPGALKPWDHAPGLLLLREAGGAARLVSGAAYEGLTPARALVCAASPALADAIAARLAPLA